MDYEKVFLGENEEEVTYGKHAIWVTYSRSTSIKSVTYRINSNILEVEFVNGSKYDYAEVPYDKFAELMNANSVGAYIAKEIKPKHEFCKVSF